ncbi:MAG: hypothetical protein JJU28_03205 [Cyclobacteriaceae bacterium]|nr:hypothetical protein [Cyclobacteriaceae bacterium]
MEFDSTREERFVAKLIQDTKKKVIEWKDEPNDRLNLPNSERPISKVYTADINGTKVRIYEYEIKFYKDESNWEWVERIRLELFDNDGASLFQFPYDYSLYKLFNAVRKANASVDDFMKAFLNE